MLHDDSPFCCDSLLYYILIACAIVTAFLAAQSSSRGLVVRRSVRPSIVVTVVTIVTVMTVVTVVTVETVVTVVTVVTVRTIVTQKTYLKKKLIKKKKIKLLFTFFFYYFFYQTKFHPKTPTQKPKWGRNSKTQIVI